MKYLRIILAVYALFYIVIGILLLEKSREGWNLFITFYFGINALVLIIGAFFERSRYTSKSKLKEGWQPTKERFIDHKSGKLMEVHFNPKSGERKYVEVN